MKIIALRFYYLCQSVSSVDRFFLLLLTAIRRVTPTPRDAGRWNATRRREPDVRVSPTPLRDTAVRVAQRGRAPCPGGAIDAGTLRCGSLALRARGPRR